MKQGIKFPFMHYSTVEYHSYKIKAHQETEIRRRIQKVWIYSRIRWNIRSNVVIKPIDSELSGKAVKNLESNVRMK